MSDTRIRLTFVHLNSPIPKFLSLNIHRSLQLFSATEVELVSDNEKFNGLQIPAGVRIQRYVRSRDTEVALSKLERNQKFRNDFWRLSIERLIALLELVIRDDVPRLHIESDVILFKDFSFKWLSKINHPLWCRYSDDRDSGAMMFIPNRLVAARMKTLMFEELESNVYHTDMTLLRAIANSGGIKYDYFPIAKSFKGEAVTAVPGTQDFWQVSQSPGETVPVVVDSASIGMWLTGQDVRNKFGILVLHEKQDNFGDLIEPDAFNYSLGSNRDSLFISDGNKTWSVVSLHIHSKQEELFRADNGDLLQNFVRKSAHKDKEKLIIPRIFLSFLIQGCRDGSLIRSCAYKLTKRVFPSKKR